MVKTQLIQPANAGDNVGVISMTPMDTSIVSVDVGGSIDSVRTEIDDCYADMKTFYQREPDEIMRICRGHSARLSELRVRIFRIEDYQRQWRAVREREIQPTLDELRDQWQNASRLHAVRELDFKMETGQG